MCGRAVCIIIVETTEDEWDSVGGREGRIEYVVES